MPSRHRSKIIELLEFTYPKPANSVFGRAMMFAYERPLLAAGRHATRSRPTLSRENWVIQPAALERPH